VLIVKTDEELKTGGVFEKIVPVTGAVPEVNSTLCTLFPI